MTFLPVYSHLEWYRVDMAFKHIWRCTHTHTFLREYLNIQNTRNSCHNWPWLLCLYTIKVKINLYYSYLNFRFFSLSPKMAVLLSINRISEDQCDFCRISSSRVKIYSDFSILYVDSKYLGNSVSVAVEWSGWPLELIIFGTSWE